MNPHPGEPAFSRPLGLDRDSQDRMLLHTKEQLASRWYSLGVDELDVVNCGAGDSRACRLLLTARFATGLRGEFVWWMIQRDSAAFARFWRAGGAFEAAAASELGAPPETLMQQFISDRVVIALAGPELPEGFWMALLWIVAPVVLAAGQARRKTVSG